MHAEKVYFGLVLRSEFSKLAQNSTSIVVGERLRRVNGAASLGLAYQTRGYSKVNIIRNLEIKKVREGRKMRIKINK